MTTETMTMNTQNAPAEVGIDVQRLVLPCRFCGGLPDWEEISPDHRWRSMRYASWDGWLTHECKAKYYALAGAQRYVYEDWNLQQNVKSDATR